MAIEYTIKAIETKFRSFMFRSRLEAKWAAMFELLEWEWDYEPVDFNGWIPDFVVYGDQPVYVEVKPVLELPVDVAEKMQNSGCQDEMLIVGQKCLLGDRSDRDDLCFGWVAESVGEVDDSVSFWWERATFGRWRGGLGKIGFCHTVGQFYDRISGGYDGGCYGEIEVQADEIKHLWAMAHNATRWMSGSLESRR